MDVTQEYGAAFYSCAMGMGLSAVCLALVGPAKAGFCQRQSKTKEVQRGKEEERRITQDNDQQDFLEVDLAPEDSPARQSSNKASVI